MNHILRYGIDSSVCLELSNDALLMANDRPKNVPDDPFGTMALALSNPLDYPALDKCVVPGDRVVVAVGVGVPCADQIVAAAIEELLRAGIEPDGITILKPFEDGVELCRLVPDDVRPKIVQAVHDATDRDRLAHLATTESDEPVLLNRLIADADFVLPIGCCRDAMAAGYFGIGDTLSPTFSDKKTIRHFRAPGSLDPNGRVKKRLVKQAGQIGWLLGAAFAVQVVPGPAGSVLAILAGEANAVEKRSRQLYDDAWQVSADGEAKLVVASIEGGTEEQTWQSVGWAVETAGRFVEKGGAIVVCSELDVEPGPALALAQWAGADARDAVLKQIAKDRHYDTLTTTQLLHAMSEYRVFLLSRLGQADVEKLDFVYVANDEEVVRLVQKYESCVVLADAAHVAVTNK